MSKTVMRSLILYLLLSLLFSGIVKSQPPSKHFTLEKIGDGVWAAIHKFGGHAICNAGIIDLGDEILIFDTFISPQAARDLKNAANTLTSKPIRYVVNSHYHNDHIRGNQVFYPFADFISTVKTRNLINQKEHKQLEIDKKYTPESLQQYQQAYQNATTEEEKKKALMWFGYYEAMSESFDELNTVLPNIVFDNKMVIHGKNNRLELIAYDKGHTGNDLVLYIPEQNILFTGDLVFNQMHPWLGNGDPDNWIDVLEKIKSLNPSHVIPGHGETSDAHSITAMQDYIKTVDELAREMVREQIPSEDIPKQPIPEALHNWQLDSFFIYNLQFMYKRAAASAESN
jgi:glyoxylase-like metal-dependent hydrolase (beta-lactamase superfamily II)